MLFAQIKIIKQAESKLLAIIMKTRYVRQDSVSLSTSHANESELSYALGDSRLHSKSLNPLKFLSDLMEILNFRSCFNFNSLFNSRSR